MLTIHVPAIELFDSGKQEFINEDAVTLELEHSLVALSKWEAKWEKPFLGPKEKSTEETLDYIRAMTLTPNVPPEVYLRLSNENFKQINDYITSNMSATWFTDRAKGGSPMRNEIITAEIIYHWIIALTIPLEFETRHLNQLFTLIKVCNEKNNPDKKKQKMTRDDLAERNKINAERKAKMQSAG